MTQKKLLKDLRANRTLEEFGKIVGLDKTAISKYENEKHAIPLKTFLEWCEKCGKKITIEQL